MSGSGANPPEIKKSKLEEAGKNKSSIPSVYEISKKSYLRQIPKQLVILNYLHTLISKILVKPNEWIGQINFTLHH